jgi:hypothetical protein
MVAEHFKLIFSFPEYKISKSEIIIPSASIKFNTVLFYSWNIDEVFNKYGNIFVPRETIRFYEVFIHGKNNLEYAKKYFLELLKRESKHSHQHEVRYLNYLKQIKEGSL